MSFTGHHCLFNRATRRFERFNYFDAELTRRFSVQHACRFPQIGPGKGINERVDDECHIGENLDKGKNCLLFYLFGLVTSLTEAKETRYSGYIKHANMINTCVNGATL